MTPRTLVTVARRVQLSVSDSQIARTVAAALGAARFRRAVEVGVTLVGDVEMRRLNRRWRRQDRTTDVLSFQEGPLTPAGKGMLPFLGDVIISPVQVRRQALEAGMSWRSEFNLMLIHGTLHLLGYDHLTKRDAAKMLPLQQRTLKRLQL
jgi:probable rRNA maturation factor